MLLLPGCNILGAGAFIVAGPPKKDAEYVLPQDRATVVVVDDRRNVVNPTPLRKQIADQVAQELLDRELVGTVIDPRDAMAAMSREDRYNEPMAMDEIGRAVGADLVIYIDMLRFSNTPDGRTPRPVATGAVRVIDVVNRTRLFPAGETSQDARPVEAMLNEMDPSVFRTRSSSNQVYEDLAVAFGSEVSKLFYRHEVRELGGNLNPR
jgi:hypothetical protein